MKHFTILLFAVLFSALAFGQREVIQVSPVGPFTDGGIKATEDTLVPAPFTTPGCSTLSAYRISGGYLCGTNGMHDKEKAERFRNAPININVNKVIALVYAGWGLTNVNTNGYSKVALYSMHPYTYKPQTLLAKSDSVANSSINVYNPYAPALQYVTYNFATPVYISGGRFFASLMLPNGGGTGNDTLYVLASTQSAVCSPDTNAWEKYVDNTWNPIRLSTWGGNPMDVDLAIMPVVVDNTGMNEEEWIETRIFPNPASEELFVMCSAPIERIIIQNLLGQTVRNQLFSGENGVRIQTDQLPRGQYILSISTKKNILTRKIEIQ